MSSIAMEICPMCAMCPQLLGRWRLQVRCSCGACGPKMKTRQGAIGRWNSVVGFVRELSQAGAAGLEKKPVRRRLSREPRWLARTFRWQPSVESDLYL